MRSVYFCRHRRQSGLFNTDIQVLLLCVFMKEYPTFWTALKVHSFHQSIVSATGRLEEKGLLFHCACAILRAECAKGTMRSVIKLWELKVINVLLYVPKPFYHLLFIQESSAYYFLKRQSVRKRTNNNFEMLCSKIYTALHLQIFSLTSISHMHHCSFIFFRKYNAKENNIGN